MIGKVLDSSAVAAVAGTTVANSWLLVSWDHADTLYVPALALAESRELRPDLGTALDDLELHPSIIVRTLDHPAEPLATAVQELLASAGSSDVLAAHAVHIATRRGWPVLTADADRLRRLDPDVALTFL